MSSSRESETNVEIKEAAGPSVPLTKHPSPDFQPVSCLRPLPHPLVLLRTHRNYLILHRRAGSVSTRIPNLLSRLNAGIHAVEDAGYAAWSRDFVLYVSGLLPRRI